MMMELMPVWLQAGAGNPLREFLLENILTGLSEAWRPLVADLLTWSLTCALIMGIVQVTMLYCTLLERKFVGRIQDRIGPNRVGYWGLLQPFADMVKMLTKEDITPAVAHRSVYNLGAILVVPPAIMVFAILPLSLGLVASDLSVGFLYFISVASVVIVPIDVYKRQPREEVAGVEAADRVDPQEALVIDEGDQEADLVHMTEEHDPRRPIVLALLGFRRLALAGGSRLTAADEAAHGIDLHLVEQTGDLCLDQVADAALVSGHTGRFAQALEPVSYTHLDVYKRQRQRSGPASCRAVRNCAMSTPICPTC